MLRKNLIADPEFSKYIFHVLVNAPEIQKKELNEVELRIWHSDKTLKRFSDNATLEQKMALMYKLGIESSVFFRKVDADLSFLKEIDKQHRSPDKRLEIIKLMESGCVFCLGSREVMFSLAMCNANAHSKVFLLDHRYKKVFDAARKVNGGSEVDKTIDLMQAYEIVAKVAVSNLLLNDKAEYLFGCSAYHMKILSALFQYKNIFTTREKLMDMLSAKESPKGFGAICGDMVTMGLLVRPPRVDKHMPDFNSYIISEKGLTIMMKYLKWTIDGI